MKDENELNDDLRQLLDTLEEHGRNTRRQAQLSDLIDGLETSGTSLTRFASSNRDLRGETTKQSRREAISQSDASASDETSSLDRFVPRDDEKRRRLIPLWWAMGAAAACLLLWLLVRPTTKQAPETNENIFVEKVEATDSVKVEKNDVVIEDPIVKEELLAEEKPAVPKKTPTKVEKPRMKVVEEKPEEPVLAEIIPAEPTKPADTENIESNTIPTENETPSTVQKPQRKVIRSLNLVCYECQKEPEHEFTTKPNVDNRTLFGQPQDPNMKNGSLAFEFKLN